MIAVITLASWLISPTAGEIADSQDTYHSLLNDGIDTGGIPLNVLSGAATGSVDYSAPGQAESAAPENVYVNGVCGGTTKPGFTAWRKSGRALDLHVDSSHCKLTGSLKTYIVSVVQGNSGNIFAGTANVFNAGHKDFRIFVYHNALSGDALLAAAQKNWVVSWAVSKNNATNPHGVSFFFW